MTSTDGTVHAYKVIVKENKRALLYFKAVLLMEVFI